MNLVFTLKSVMHLDAIFGKFVACFVLCAFGNQLVVRMYAMFSGDFEFASYTCFIHTCNEIVIVHLLVLLLPYGSFISSCSAYLLTIEFLFDMVQPTWYKDSIGVYSYW